ncbi:DEKNAAC101902 [Brettanomyces naardenensis]|uniref:DEKNAAC101902 n=1 Tax=Brettanomyces naardenensis TaxID=13370 RepID=A0A448YJF7_BRENA|nr:DEKNAAC101902 [Brettanomyces naardenensis]
MAMSDSNRSIKRRRNRKFVVCTNCRRKKIKCDKKLPCSNCVKAGLVCEFKAPSGRPIALKRSESGEEREENGGRQVGEGQKDTEERNGLLEQGEQQREIGIGLVDTVFNQSGHICASVGMMDTGVHSVDQVEYPTDIDRDPSIGISSMDPTLASSFLSSPSVDASDSPHSLQLQIEELKRKLAQVSLRLHTEIAPSLHPSILDIKLTSLKRAGVSAKPSSTIFLGPTSGFTGFSRPMINCLFSSMKNTLDEERRAWKQLHHSNSRAIRFTGDPVDEDIAIGLVQQIVCPNYHAFQERLIYFQSHLNHLLYSDFVPMDIILTLFLSSFKEPDQNSIAQFSRPRKCYFYADIALIVSIVYLVVIFTRYNTQAKAFAHPLLVQTEELSSLGLKLLSISEYRRKKTQLALLTLIVLRSALFVHDNSEGANELVNSYPVFQMSLDLCYQMGIHFPDSASPDSLAFYMSKDKLTMKSRSMTAEQVRDLWNYIQQEDALYSVCMGTPLLVNYRFSSPLYRMRDNWIESKRADAIMLLREISLTANSTGAITMRDILKLIDKVTRYCHEIPFKVFATSTADLDGLANIFRLKLQLLQTLQCLCRMIINAASDSYSKNPSWKLNSLCEEMYRQSLLAASAVIFTVRDVFEGNTVFGNEKDGKYIIFLRDILSQGVGVGFMIWFAYVLAKATKNTEIITENSGPLLSNYPPESAFEGEINVYSIEDALYHKYTGKGIDFCERLSSKLVSSSVLMTFSSPLYDIVSQNMVMRNSLDSFMILKLVIMWLYVLQTVQECESDLESKRVTVGDIMTKTKEKVESSFNLGRLDERLKLNTDEYELEKIFDSLFNGEVWSSY